jgi:hypothetical protein
MNARRPVSSGDLNLARDARNKLLDIYNRIKESNPQRAASLDGIVARLEAWLRA